MKVRAVRIAAMVAAAAAVASCAGASPGATHSCRPDVLCASGLPTLPTLAHSRRGGAIDRYLAVRRRGIALARLDGRVLWRVSTPAAAARPRLLAAGDFTGDGRTDYVFWILRAPDRPAFCGGRSERVSELLFVDGSSGRTWKPAASLADICWQELGYPTHQWDFGTVYVGEFAPRYAGSEVVLIPYYATEGGVLNFTARRRWVTVRGRDGARSFPYPSVPGFDVAYNSSNRSRCSQPLGSGHCFVTHSHVANGVFVGPAGAPRFFTMTSMRALLYRSDLTPTADTTWVPGDVPATNGRNYGLVEAYRSRGSTYVDLLAGCSVEQVRRAMRHGGLTADWDRVCGIARHFDRFRIRGETVTRDAGAYYGYSGLDGPLEGRVEFPGSPHAALGGRGTAWTVFNRYRNGRWSLLAFDGPRGVEPRVELRGWFVWDTADVDGDGRAELLATRVERGYRSPWAFDVLRWRGRGFVSSFHAGGIVPALLRYASTPAKHTTEENVFGVLTRRERGGSTRLLVERSNGRLSWLRGKW